MTFLSSIEHLSLTSGITWMNFVILFALTLLNGGFALPAFERAAVALMGRFAPLRLVVSAQEVKASSLAPAMLAWALILGAAAGTLRAVRAEDFTWYLTEALAWWPDYGAWMPWAVNALIGLAALGAVATAAVLLRRFGAVAGGLLTVAYGLAAVGAAWAGLLGGPVALGLLALLLRTTLLASATYPFAAVGLALRPAR